MKKTFISNLILLVGLNLLVKPIYLLVVEAEIQNRVGSSQFGLYFALLNLTFILNILLDLGMTNHNTRFIASHAGIPDKHLNRMLKIRLGLAGLFMIAALVAGFILKYGSHEIWMLTLLGLAQVFSSSVLYLRSYLTGMHLFQQDSFISILDKALLVLVMFTLLLSTSNSEFDITWLIYGQVSSYAITAITAWFLVHQIKSNSQVKQDSRPLVILKESAPYATLILVSMLAYRIDTIMLERLQGSEESGIYAMGFRFFEAINMISYLFAVLLLPMFSRLLSNKEDVSSLLHTGLKLMFTGTWIAFVASRFFSEKILDLIYDHSIYDAQLPFMLMMLSALFFSLQYITGTLITASGEMKTMITIAAVSLLFNFTVNLFMVSRYGAIGCAITSAITQGAIFIAQFLYVFRKFNTKPIGKMILQVAVFALITYLPWQLELIPIFKSSELIISLLFCGAIGISAAYITGMLDYKFIFQLFHKNQS
jgi:O-antigen/teichoic acid export membrane protein